MNFFSAVASAISQGSPLPYNIGDKVDVEQSVWTLNNATKKDDGSNCSVFSFDINANKSRLPLAKNALRKMRTLRHPGVIKVLDTVETETHIYIATERVTPLRWHVRRKTLAPETIKWGLHSVARTIKFINTEATSIHGNIKVGSVYTSESGEWKLGGFEVLSNVNDDEAVIYTYGGLVPDSGRYAAPEVARGGWDVIKKNPLSALDAFGLGCLVFEAFNGDFTGTDQAGQTKNVPPSMHASYKRLVNANPKARLSAAHFVDQGQRSGSFFDSPLIKLTEGIDNLGVKSEGERDAFFDDLEQVTDDFPEDFFKLKVLPELLKSVEFGGGGPKAFGVVMKISAKLTDEDFDSRIQPVVVRLFSNPDRAIRVCLLDNLPLMIDRLPQKVVNDKIFPQLVTGFTDMAPVVREQTLKSVLVIISKLSDRTINGELLRHLAKTANDEQPGIRTNTTICLGKIAKNLGVSSRAKVLIAAFTRSLRDPFVHGRNAALMALGATSEHFGDEDSATRIMPAICPLLVDKEKPVREQATKTLDIFMQKIRKAAANMPDTALPPPTTESATGPRMSTPQPSEGSSWTGWAISSFTNKISTAAGEMQTNGTGSGSSTPQAVLSPGLDGKRSTSSASALHRQAVKSPAPSVSRQPPPPPTASADSFFQDDAADTGDAWGDMEDMGDDDDVPGSQPASKAPASRQTSSSTATPFDDAEPDFAGWLAAQQQKKSSVGKPLPKGLSKPSAAGAKKPLVTRPAAKPVAAKKIDLKPKQADDDDGWGDGW
ncbi:armadillo-type protein [Plectosphaerella cucumerina]|uniref:Armadillo-type protein n=1 Tax=Plectosphaerella cucumerina TaxID=40658 RepID=A0A8K0X2K1_9PEZI|nr:armadillo-type protein [Plectosphaerella cucumerina]